MKNRWFDVDKQGLRNLVEQHGMGRLIAELVQNESASTIAVAEIFLLPRTRPLTASVLHRQSVYHFSQPT